jgi:predicted enzyme related to lactoylglutathione lyase
MAVEGTPIWVDLSAADFEGAQRFYGDLFGWEIQVGDESLMYYSNALLDGARVAGLAPRQSEDQPSVWTTYLASDDADATAAKIREHGGTVVMEPMQIEDYGRMLLATDPTGAFFGVWEGGTHTGAEKANEPGTVAWNELNTRDGKATDAFYSSVFGVTTLKYDGPGGVDYSVWAAGGTDIGADGVAGRLQMNEDWPDEIPPHWMVYFAVDDTDKACARIIELGGNVNVEPFDLPFGRTAVVSDPWGTHFSIITLAP